jgi:hypothetical protein
MHAKTLSAVLHVAAFDETAMARSLGDEDRQQCAFPVLLFVLDQIGAQIMVTFAGRCEAPQKKY